MTTTEASGAVAKPPLSIPTPGQPPTVLVAYYDKYAEHYPVAEIASRRWISQNLPEDAVCIDAGAHLGYYAVCMARAAPQGVVHAFEPTRTAAMLRQNLAHNGVTNCVVHERALSDRPGPRPGTLHRLWGEPPDEREFDFTTVDRFVETQGLDRLDFLKIDVDSYDFDVLRGAEQTLERFDPVVQVELSHALSLRKQHATIALAWLARRGYRNARVTDFNNFLLRRAPIPGSPAPGSSPAPNIKAALETSAACGSPESGQPTNPSDPCLTLWFDDSTA
ncbi:MAG: FkbM family methyltransferase [Planctomycetota bacterium]